MSNLSKDLILDGYCVNKKSGTIHSVCDEIGYDGRKKLFTSTLNLRHERCYFFRGSAVDRFLKNYEFVCGKEDVTDSFFVNVLSDVSLKNLYTWGSISKEEFFGKVFN